MPNELEDYEIAAPRLEDLEALEGIELAAAALFPPEDLSLDLRDEGLPRSFFERAAKEGRLWVARSRRSGEPVGFAAAVLVDGAAHLHEVDVHPDHGRRGLGRALVERTAAWARDAGYPSLTLTTFRHLPWNAPFYASVGFEEVQPADVGPELRALLDEEADNGLDPSKRVAMRLSL